MGVKKKLQLTSLLGLSLLIMTACATNGATSDITADSADFWRKVFKEMGVRQSDSLWPILIQMPVILALFQALSRVDFLKTGHFLWINLGGVDTTLVLPILAAVFTFLSTWLSNKALSERNGATTAMMYGIPVLIFIFGVYAPSGVALYWAVSNAYQVLQTYFLNNPFKIIAEREAVAQAQKDLENRKRKAKKKAQKTK